MSDSARPAGHLSDYQARGKVLASGAEVGYLQVGKMAVEGAPGEVLVSLELHVIELDGTDGATPAWSVDDVTRNDWHEATYVVHAPAV